MGSSAYGQEIAWLTVSARPVQLGDSVDFNWGCPSALTYFYPSSSSHYGGSATLVFLAAQITVTRMQEYPQSIPPYQSAPLPESGTLTYTAPTAGTFTVIMRCYYDGNAIGLGPYSCPECRGSGQFIVTSATSTSAPELQVTVTCFPSEVRSGDSVSISASVTASDQSTPASISYSWSAAGGENAVGGGFNDASAPSPIWVAPMVGFPTSFTINVKVSAPGYSDGAGSCPINVLSSSQPPPPPPQSNPPQETQPQTGPIIGSLFALYAGLLAVLGGWLGLALFIAAMAMVLAFLIYLYERYG